MDGNLPAPQQDLALLKQQDEHQYALAKLNIETSYKDQCETRLHFAELARIDKRNGLIFVLVFLVLLFSFGFYALSLGKENFLADILKVVIGAFGGGGLGYAIGLRRRPPPGNNQ